MPDAQPLPEGTLSSRAQEILRRADAQLATLRAPAPAAPDPELAVAPEPLPA
ncbi:MAG: hypothetical protein JWM71_1496, partial [Solirubrobacteraceae bacterium]|nr:hypothetical protein [Solirubrobacteraceae bacterium]